MDDKQNQSDIKTPQPKDSSKQAAIELIRKKVEAAYGHEPTLEAEVRAVKPKTMSKHQRYAQELTRSGRPLGEIHAAWHDYYKDLSDEEKHEVWREFYQAHGQDAYYEAYTQSGGGLPTTIKPQLTKKLRRARTARRHPATSRIRRYQPPAHIRSLIVGLAAGLIAIFILLFSFFNERFIAPFIQPSRAVTSIQLISDTAAVGPEPEIIIPKINVEIPVVYGVTTTDEKTLDVALENGVLHYADTAEPGQNGNGVIVGHSSNNIFNKGRYKFAFVLLSRLENGDTFYLQKDGVRYTYQVYDKKIVKPDDFSVLGNTSKTATMSLITCDPPGTSINRLVVIGEQISPNPDTNKQTSSNSQATTKTKTIPGNSPTLWSRLWNWFSR